MPMLLKLYRYLMRRKVVVQFHDLTRTWPVSDVFGLERGLTIDRYYIERFLAAHSELVRGRVLEVADTDYSRRFGGGRVEAFEVLHAAPGNPAATVVGDLADPDSLPEGIADCFVCTQTLECIFDLPAAVRGTHRLLKSGGVLLATVPGLAQVSRYDQERWGDYWRFTTASAERLFRPVFQGGVEVASYGNVLAATALLQGVAVEDLPDASLLDAEDDAYQVVVSVVARKA